VWVCVCVCMCVCVGVCECVCGRACVWPRPGPLPFQEVIAQSAVNIAFETAAAGIVVLSDTGAQALRGIPYIGELSVALPPYVSNVRFFLPQISSVTSQFFCVCLNDHFVAKWSFREKVKTRV